MPINVFAFLRLAVEAGTSNDRDTSLNLAKAGNDHEVLVSCVHPGVIRVAVAPGGKPVTVSSVVVGNVVPAVGTIAIVYVAVPPGETVCDVPPPPLLPDTGSTPKLMTTCESTLLEVAEKFVSPLYTAVIESEPVAKDEVVKVAMPPESAPDPNSAVPLMKFMPPVGIPTVEPTVAVNVTGLCETAGLTLVVRVAVGFA